MTIVIGYPPKRAGKAALHLAATLARSAGEDLLVTSVVPARWLPGRGSMELPILDYVQGLARQALDQAKADLPADLSAQFTTVQARSVAGGLLEVAAQHGASTIVVGSSSAGLFGRIAMSSVAERLLHISPVPVAMATRGFRTADTSLVTRLTVGYDGTEHGDQVLAAARPVADALGTSLRLVAFAVQLPPPDTAMFNAEAGQLIRTWEEDIREAAQRAVPGDPCPVVIGHGRDWSEALEDVEWEDGELLVVGSSASGPLARVFLGSRAVKIIRHAPVPVLVLPRAAE